MCPLTLRALVTGMVLGAVLTPCNIYSGLKIGWSFNMSITAALLSLLFWRIWQQSVGAPTFGIGENAINQTAASSAASIVSGGLVAPIPAYTLLTGQTLSLPALIAWVFAVSVLGVFVAFSLRQQLLVREQATFPAGVATAEMLRDIYAQGAQAWARIRALVGATVIAASVKLYDSLLSATPRLPRLSLPVAWAPAALGNYTPTLSNLTFGFEPSLLMVGFGAIIGIRVGLSLLGGALLAWGIIGPLGLSQHWLAAGPADPTASWFGDMIEWLLWPGVALMVSASLTSFLFALLPRRQRSGTTNSQQPVQPRAAQATRPVYRCSWFWAGLLAVAMLLIGLQHLLFGIDWFNAILAIPVAFLLGSVAARVVADTGIPPIGALGKMSQVSFAVTAPGNATTNLMTANVAGGTAGQCADLFNDLKTGHLLGINPRYQFIAQLCGILTGAMVGSVVYLVLIPDPQAMLLTEQWAAPAVATWQAVAQTLSTGLDSIGLPARLAMLGGAVTGVFIEVLRRFLPAGGANWLPSATALGLAFVIPASLSVALFLGAALAWLFQYWRPQWARQLTIPIAAGLVAGEGLAGVAAAFVDMLR